MKSENQHRNSSQSVKFSYFIGLIILIVGSWTASHLPFRWTPPPKLEEIFIKVSWPTGTAQTSEHRMLRDIEGAIQESSAIKRIETRTSEGHGLITASLVRGQNKKLASVDILDRLASLRRSLPPGASLTVSLQIPNGEIEQRSFMIIQLVSPLTTLHLEDLQGQHLVKQLLRVPGIAHAEIRTDERRELRALLYDRPFKGLKTSISHFNQNLTEGLRDSSYGALSASTRQALFHRATRVSLSLANIPGSWPRPHSTTLRLADLGRIKVASAPLQGIHRIDGHAVVTLTLHRTPDSQLLHIAPNVRKTIEELHKKLPPGTQLLIADDRSEHIRKQLNDLALRSGLGLFLIIIVLTTMLRSGKAVAITLFVVLVSLSAAIILFKPLNITLNVLTIAGLVLLFGLLVDNAVVVIERLQTELTNQSNGNPLPYTTAARRAVRAVWLPLLGGTLSTCAVFLPMVYLSGELRSLFASFAILSALTLLFSLVTSTVLIPKLSQSLKSHQPPRTAAVSRIRATLLLPYHLASRHPRLSFLLLLLAIGLPTPLVPDFIEEPSEGWQDSEDRDFAARYNRTLGSDPFREARLRLDPVLGGVTRPFLKNVELGKRWDFPKRPEINVWIKLPAGSGIHRADERIRPFEEEARGSSAVKRTLVNVSGRIARMTVLFHDEAMDTDEPYLLRERLIAHALQIAGMEVSVSGLVPMGFYSGLGQVSGFTVHAYGPTYEKLEEVSKNFARRLEHYPRVAEVDINAAGHRQPPAREVIRFRWGADAIARTGLSARELADVLRPQLWRETPDFYADLDGNPRMPVRIVMEGAEDLDLDTLLHRPLATGPGGPVRLADHAELSIKKDPPVIERIDQQYRRTLRVYYRGPYRMGRKMLDKEIAGMPLPPGYRLERPRYEFFDKEVQRQFFWLILGTVALVFLVISAVLESWRLAVVVMLSVPLAWIGIALAFLLTGQNFAEGAFIGIVLTIGIAVNDSILLADRYRNLRQARPTTPVPRLALLALRQRLRPMWTTTLTSITGMLPLLIIPEAGNFWIGLAVTVVGGLLASTLLAPAATLALLSWVHRPPTAVVRTSTTIRRELYA